MTIIHINTLFRYSSFRLSPLSSQERPSFSPPCKASRYGNPAQFTGSILNKQKTRSLFYPRPPAYLSETKFSPQIKWSDQYLQNKRDILLRWLFLKERLSRVWSFSTRSGAWIGEPGATPSILALGMLAVTVLIAALVVVGSLSDLFGLNSPFLRVGKDRINQIPTIILL
jgi:hypothetical protein